MEKCANDDGILCDNYCVPSYWKCDGIVDCSDASDETLPICGNIDVYFNS